MTDTVTATIMPNRKWLCRKDKAELLANHHALCCPDYPDVKFLIPKDKIKQYHKDNRTVAPGLTLTANLWKAFTTVETCDDCGMPLAWGYGGWVCICCGYSRP